MESVNQIEKRQLRVVVRGFSNNPRSVVELRELVEIVVEL